MNVRRGERAVAVADRRPGARVAEADDVGATIAIEIGHQPGVAGDLPALARTEFREHQCCRLERAVSIAQGNPDTVIPKSDDVCSPVAGEVGDHSRVLVDAPTLVVAQIGEDELRLLEAAVAIAQGDPHAVGAKAEDVGLAVAGDIGDEARMLIHAPPLVISEVRGREFRRLEGAIPVVQRGPHAGISKAGDVRMAVPGEIRQEAGMPLDHPSSPQAECRKGHVRRLERAIPVVQRCPNAFEAEPDDIRSAIASEICNESGLVGTPALTTPTHAPSSLG